MIFITSNHSSTFFSGYKFVCFEINNKGSQKAQFLHHKAPMVTVPAMTLMYQLIFTLQLHNRLQTLNRQLDTCALVTIF